MPSGPPYSGWSCGTSVRPGDGLDDRYAVRLGERDRLGAAPE